MNDRCGRLWRGEITAGKLTVVSPQFDTFKYIFDCWFRRLNRFLLNVLHHSDRYILQGFQWLVIFKFRPADQFPPIKKTEDYIVAIRLF
ncbi:hypothetical protein CEF21_07670 [Bacillus sp. FJAT-42376]|nr:hypothetical protein CEF21_07670 [Bacillus sp. FJAT-42376]